MRQATVLLLVLGLTLLGHAAPASQSADPFLIVPGDSIGPVHLGMPFDDVLAMWGRYSSKDANPTTLPLYIWDKLPERRLIGRLAVRTMAMRSPETVAAITVLLDARYKTDTGIRVGDSSASVRKLMGEPAKIRSTSYWGSESWHYSGLVFFIGPPNAGRWADRAFAICVPDPAFDFC